MHVAFIGTRGVPASYSGFETCVEQVGKRMVQRGHEVTVFCRSGHYQDRLSTYLGMRLRYLPAIPGKHLETLSHSLLTVTRLPRRSAIVCMGVGNAPVVRLLELMGRHCVFNVDGADWQRDKWGGPAKRYLRACERLAARGRSPIIADAQTVQKYYSAEYGRNTELVVYGAEPPADTGTTVLQELGLQRENYVLFVGRLVPENAPHDFLQGVKLAGLSIPAVVVGDATYMGDYIARLRTMAPSNAIFAGYRFGSSYQQLSAHAAIFVLGATVGGTHPVLVEQMAAGNCILARDTDSNREVLGDAGLYWQSPQDLAELLSRAWADGHLRLRLGSAARTRSAELYDWDLVTTRYLELCERTL
jgi:glycosyltransferase involved in cell wall biosynthesis